ncbi:transcriptional regulator [Candidatus Shapirobacteria bacterium CG06_land_8_20_14_3_00_40_12]|uniref:Transcriptional regulator n=1 Tax=Candidatus Shapirobacteria bacterium CG06_land_8_20_14_3_00_40_12 TaxID=1974881 RepID=A0A2M7ASS1_9BACT|nr:MAG: transcriptional regulator [Candidatus Shapirobacteria bacterium CG06_land_8_20_14_3_00_40_12]
MKTKIREYRSIRNLTQSKLAESVGVRRETIIYLEKGKYMPSLKLAHDVAKTLKTKVDKLFTF